jgi:hypothetical protein
VNGDLTNLIESIDVVYVVLDSELRIRRFTPTALKVMNLIPGDIGRPIGDLKTNLQVDNLTDLIQEAIVKVRYREQDVRDLTGRWYSMKIQPYKTQDHRIDGAILALSDVDALRRVEESARALEANVRSLVRNPPDLLLVPTTEGHILLVNGVRANQTSGLPASILDLVGGDREAVRACLERVLQTGVADGVEVQNFTFGKSSGRALLEVDPLTSGDGVIALSIRGRGAAASRSQAT